MNAFAAMVDHPRATQWAREAITSAAFGSALDGAPPLSAADPFALLEDLDKLAQSMMGEAGFAGWGNADAGEHEEAVERAWDGNFALLLAWQRNLWLIEALVGDPRVSPGAMVGLIRETRTWRGRLARSLGTLYRELR